MLRTLKDFFTPRSETRKQASASYRRPPSFSDKLPWVEYWPQEQCFPLADNRSVAAVFELSDVASEARSQEYLDQLQRGLQGVFQDVFPSFFDEESPWVIQFYVQDDLSLVNLNQSLKEYVKPHALNTVFTQHFLKIMEEHTEYMTRPEGMFIDDKVSGNVYRGKLRRVRAVIYRKLTGHSKLRRGRTAVQDLNNIAYAFINKFESCGVKVRRYSGKEFYEWMVKWFNPAPRGYCDTDDLLAKCPYPGDEAMPFGYDFAERFFYSVPESDNEKGVWYFDELPHKYLSITGLNSLPRTGHLTVERVFGNHFYGLFDKFPEGSTFVLTVAIQSQEQVKNHIFRIEQSARHGKSTEANMAQEDAEIAKRAIESGNYFFPTDMGVYIRGKDLQDLYDKETDVETLLSSNGLIYIDGDNELLPLDNYVRHLPMNYDFIYEKDYLSRSRYLTGKQISQLLPLYGRERGTGHPGLIFFNRCGEPFLFDPFNALDKDFNSHFLLLGTTGSGKSATCVYLMMLLMAIYRPRLVIIDAGNSFGLLSSYFQDYGLVVNRVEISLNNPVSLNPFAESQKMLVQVRSFEEGAKERWIIKEEEEIEKELASAQQVATATEIDEAVERDYMAEMCLAAQLMITGGEHKEADKITRQDRMLIIDALILAAQNAKAAGFDQMIPGDLAVAMNQMADQLDTEASESNSRKSLRLREMADGIQVFCKDAVSSMYFNQRGKPWPEADITVFEMGLFKEEGYEAQRALAFMGIMNKSMSLAEQHQHEERFTVFLGDEVHIVTRNPLTAVSITRSSKMSRKLGFWLWLASQNIQDFPDEARKMLSMIEFWLCLGMSEAEMSEIERFKSLTDEQKILFRSVRKARGKFMEGVLLCNRLQGLLRNIPPRLSLSLAMTEKEEKAERRRLMQQYGITEVEAAIHIAHQMLGKSSLEVKHETA